MGEKMGFLTVLLLFGLGILPLLISTFYDHTQNAKLLTVSTEMQQLVASEGGVTPTVNDHVSSLSEKGYEISFFDEGGSPVTGVMPVGETIFIKYKIGNYVTSNKALITRR